MKKPEIAKQLARQSGITRAAAADELDRVVSSILTHVRRGEDVAMPGLGRFTPGPKRQVAFEREGPKPNEGK